MVVVIVKIEVNNNILKYNLFYYNIILYYNMNQYMIIGACVLFVVLLIVNGSLLGVITEGTGC